LLNVLGKRQTTEKLKLKTRNSQEDYHHYMIVLAHSNLTDNTQRHDIVGKKNTYFLTLQSVALFKGK